MATKILIDIQNDVKLLITAITGFEEGEEGFHICEAFALSNIKHHRYLSVDGHATKRSIAELTKKYSIHGKYKVSKKFQELVNTFLNSFDFEHHPQYDLQWTLLSFLLNLSNETNKSEIQCLDSLRSSRAEHNLNVTCNIGNKKNDKDQTEDIDWGIYLNQGKDEFFSNYKSSDDDSDWSEDEPLEALVHSKASCLVENETEKELTSLIEGPKNREQVTLDKISRSLSDGVESKNWLKRNVQNEWWRSMNDKKYLIESKFADASFSQLWDDIKSKGINETGTLSEYQTCREIIWMLNSPEGMALFLEDKEQSKFSIKKQISIPSLSSDAFSSILKPLSEYFTMLKELEKFSDSLYRKSISLETLRRPPLTYEAYQRALSQQLNKLRKGIIVIEKKFIKQDDCNTLLSLINDLRIYLDGIKILWEVHRSVIIEWEYNSNFKCASKILSGLFFEMQNSSSKYKWNICASIYLQSLSVYLNIIDTWLSEGRLEDWRKEFIISKVSKDVTIEDEENGDKFIVRKLDSICSKDPIMQLLIKKVQDIGQSIELLVSLDRIPDMWRMVNEINVCRISLNGEFLSSVISEFSKYNPIDLTDTVEISITEIQQLDQVHSSIERNIFKQISNTDDPFLLKAFEDYIPFDIFETDVDVVDGEDKGMDIIDETEDGLDIFERLQSISESILPSQRILNTVLSKILDSRYEGASKLVKDIMVNEYQLEKHLKLMRCVYMMETGHVMNKFYQLLFTEIESNATWNSPNSLTNILEEILSNEWPESSSRWTIVAPNAGHHQVLIAVDKITLHYAIGWPICMVLTEESLVKYNAIFRFQLKLKWALWTLDHLRFSDLEGKKSSRIKDRLQHFQARRLEALRFWLIHAIGSIHSYLSGQVLQGLGFMLEKALAEADNLNTIIRVHNDYLIKVHEHCLQTSEFEDLITTINSLLEMCIHVRDRWKKGAENIIPSELDTMETSYIKYHTYLALALHNAVQHKDADYYKQTPHEFNNYDESEESGSTDSRENEISLENRMTELSKNLFSEIAFQSLPPSGISIPIPRAMTIKGSNDPAGLAMKMNRLDNEDQLQFQTMNQYEKTFSYLRWYYYEKSTEINQINNSSRASDSLFNQLDKFVKEFENQEEFDYLN